LLSGRGRNDWQQLTNLRTNASIAIDWRGSQNFTPAPFSLPPSPPRAQTDMYKRETRAIGKLLEQVMLKRYGPQELPDRYLEMGAICDATQTRQDAITELAEKREQLELDFILVIGGWDSSNTQHLLEIPAGRSASLPRTPSPTGWWTATL